MAIVLPRPAMLVLNAGSSSLKFSLFAADSFLDPSVHGLVDGIGVRPPRARARGSPWPEALPKRWTPPITAAPSTPSRRGWSVG